MVKRSVMADFVKEYKGVLATFASLITLFLMFMAFSNGKMDKSAFDTYKEGHKELQNQQFKELKDDIKDIKEGQDIIQEDIKELLEKS
jgi:predicted RND superfamily exporter protein